MVKTYNVHGEDENGNYVIIDRIKLVFNVTTFIIYHGYTGHDLMADFNNLALENMSNMEKIRPEIKEQIKSGTLDMASLTAEDIKLLATLDNAQNNTFLLNFIASLIATARYPEKVDYIDIINEIPMEMLRDKDFANELRELMAFGLADKKKQVMLHHQ